MEEKSGTIEPGKWADVTIIDRDFSEPEKDVREAKVVTTIVGGEEV